MRLCHNYIGTEHLLLGMVNQEESMLADVLHHPQGIEPDQLIRAVEQTVKRGEQDLTGKPTLAPRTKRVIELAVDEARTLNAHYIDVEHIFLGIVREGQGIAMDVLRGLDTDLDQACVEARRILSNRPNGTLT